MSKPTREDVLICLKEMIPTWENQKNDLMEQFEKETEAKKMNPIGDGIRRLDGLIFDADSFIEKLEGEDLKDEDKLSQN